MRHADHYEQPHPFCVIEVKKVPGGDFAEDLRKFETLLGEVSTIRYAFLATYFQHRIGAAGRSRTADAFVNDLDGTVRAAAEDHDLDCRRVEWKWFRGRVMDDDGNVHCAGAIIHRFGAP